MPSPSRVHFLHGQYPVATHSSEGLSAKTCAEGLWGIKSLVTMMKMLVISVRRKNLQIGWVIVGFDPIPVMNTLGG